MGLGCIPFTLLGFHLFHAMFISYKLFQESNVNVNLALILSERWKKQMMKSPRKIAIAKIGTADLPIHIIERKLRVSPLYYEVPPK